MRAGTWIVAALAAAGCTAGPDYQRPAVDTPAQWHVEPPWRVATPRDDAPKGAWWAGFSDADLDRLESQALSASPTLAIAAARLEQARATLEAATGLRYPQASIGTRDQRLR